MRPIEVLMIDDSAADRKLTQACLRQGKLLVNVTEVTNGLDALELLRRRQGADEPLPDLILLDLNMPGMDGRQFMEALGQEEKPLSEIPVVVLTTSDAERDIAASYELGATCFASKPVDIEQFSRVVKGLDGFWFSVVRSPASS